MVFFIRRGIGRQHKAVQHAKAEHQHKHQPVQRHAAPHGKINAKEHHNAGQQPDQQKEPGQKSTDLFVSHQQRQRAVHGFAVYGKGIVPQHSAVAAAHGQPAGTGILRFQGHAVAAACAAGHVGIQPHAGVLPGHNVRHIAGGAGQHLAGVGIGKFQVQLTGGLAAAGAKHKGHGQQVIVGIKGLGSAVGFVQLGAVLAVIIADALRQALVIVGAHCGQPNQHHGQQAGSSGAQGGAQRAFQKILYFAHTGSSRFWWFSVQGVSKTNTGIFNVSAAPIKSLRQRLF